MTRIHHVQLPVFVMIFAVMGLVGCGESTGSIKGKVYYQDKAVPAGDVTFIPKNEKIIGTAIIQPDGSYEIQRVGAGPATISVSGPMEVKVPGGKEMAAGKMGVAGKEAGTVITKVPVVNLPEKYKDVKSSGLTFEVKSGSNQHDIKLQ